MTSAKLGTDDAKWQWRRFPLGGGPARCARLGGRCGTLGALPCLDLLDFHTKRLKALGGGIAAQRVLDLSSACFQEFTGVFEVCRRCDGRTLLDGLNGLGQARRLRFETLQAEI